MHRVIDTPWNTTRHLKALRRGGVETIIRYYNHQNSSSLNEKRVEKSEAKAIAEAGLSLAVVFQQRGGAKGNIADLDAASGRADAMRALELAERIGQPEGSAIYFAVDHDFYKSSHLASIRDYFAAVAAQTGGAYRIGVYGSGLVGKTVRDAGYADLIWLAAATGWAGTRAMLQTGGWALRQIWPAKSAPLPHDGNILSPAWQNFGQFTPGGEAGPAEAAGFGPWGQPFAMMQVIARNGLNLRRGPGSGYAVEKALVQGAIVQALGRHGDWVNVDLDGDGYSDGFMHGAYLQTVSGGFPASVAHIAAGMPPKPEALAEHRAAAQPASAMYSMDAANWDPQSPYDIARAELALDVREVPGPGNNPRIVMYHSTTNAWSGTDDSVAWCSSFVNYCVEQGGYSGTGSQRALNWADWGIDAFDAPREGDIVVFERVGKGGHVGFLIEDQGDYISVLGGNQNNRVRISSYPKNGRMGGTEYKLRAIRRA